LHWVPHLLGPALITPEDLVTSNQNSKHGFCFTTIVASFLCGVRNKAPFGLNHDRRRSLPWTKKSSL